MASPRIPGMNSIGHGQSAATRWIFAKVRKTILCEAADTGLSVSGGESVWGVLQIKSAALESCAASHISKLRHNF